MATLPDETALSGPGIGASGRPISAPDTTGYARGAAAIGQGAADLGKGIGKAGDQLARAGRIKQAEDDKLEVARAKADFLTQKTELDSSLGSETDHETLPGRYSAKLQEIKLGAAAKITNPRTRELFELSVADDVARGNAGADSVANKLWADATLADTETRLETIRQSALKTTDPEERRKLIETGNDLITSLADKRIITESKAVGVRQSWSTKYAEGAVGMLQPEDRLRALGGFEKTLVRQESSGNPRNVNQFGYAGLYQFGAPRLETLGLYKPGAGEDLGSWSKSGKDAAGKWSGTFNIPGHPEVRTLQDFLGSPDAQRAAYGAHTKRMDKEIADNGFDRYIGQEVGGTRITRDGLYAMLHLGGVGGTRDALEGKADARDANGKSVLDYARLGSQSDMVRVAAMLPEDTRVRMERQAENELHAGMVRDRAEFQQRVSDTTAEAMATGDVARPLTLSDFEKRGGPELGAKAYDSYKSAIEYGRDLFQVARMDPQEQDVLSQSYGEALKPGAEGFADKLKRKEGIDKAIAQARKERDADAAAYALKYLPASGAAWQKFAAVNANAAAAPADKQAAARSYADATLIEQARAGVPAELRRVVPKAYVDNFNRMLTRPDASGGTLNVAAAIEREAQIWGDRWPDVYREIAKSAQPVVRVIGSGVTPAAAQILTETASVPLDQILKDQDVEKSAQVKKDVLSAFKPLAATMAGNEGAIAVFNDFRGQGEKLAAYYVMRGMASSDAAAKAFDELVGHKYDFSAGSYRVPKDIAFTPAQIADGVAAARAGIEKLDFAPARDTFGGLPADYLKQATASAYARDGVWVTAPDESGLALIYKDRAVRKGDGSPLVLSWKQLADLGKAAPRGSELEAAFGGSGGMP